MLLAHIEWTVAHSFLFEIPWNVRRHTILCADRTAHSLRFFTSEICYDYCYTRPSPNSWLNIENWIIVGVNCHLHMNRRWNDTPRYQFERYLICIIRWKPIWCGLGVSSAQTWYTPYKAAQHVYFVKFLKMVKIRKFNFIFIFIWLFTWHVLGINRRRLRSLSYTAPIYITIQQCIEASETSCGGK